MFTWTYRSRSSADHFAVLANFLTSLNRSDRQFVTERNILQQCQLFGYRAQAIANLAACLQILEGSRYMILDVNDQCVSTRFDGLCQWVSPRHE
jgi:hypothetical protein